MSSFAVYSAFIIDLWCSCLSLCVCGVPACVCVCGGRVCVYVVFLSVSVFVSGVPASLCLCGVPVSVVFPFISVCAYVVLLSLCEYVVCSCLCVCMVCCRLSHFSLSQTRACPSLLVGTMQAPQACCSWCSTSQITTGCRHTGDLLPSSVGPLVTLLLTHGPTDARTSGLVVYTANALSFTWELTHTH